MKIQGFQKTGLTMAAAIVMGLSSINAFCQDSTVPPAPATTAPALNPAVAQVLELSQAKISDGTIITYVQNSGTIYGLDASQIVYLKQQGVSEPVINAMLNQRNAMAAAAAQQPPPPQQNNPQTTGMGDQQNGVAQPTTPAPSAYVVPDSQTYNYNAWAYPYYYSYPYYYPYYSSYYWGWPAYSYWGWRGGYYSGWRGGGYYGGGHGGYYGGGGAYHTGGGWSGGGGGGGSGGGWHGGGGGGHH
jgi:hypothetical protein